MKSPLLRPLMLALCAATATAATAATPDATDARIARVLAGLRPPVSFVGDATWTLQDRMKHYGVPGLTITVIDHNGLAWTRVYGLADRERGVPVKPDTLFQAASISKAVTAFGAMTLVQAGKLSLQRPVNEQLKSWRIPENEFTRETPVTLDHLLSHTGGLTVHGFMGYAPDAPVPDVLAVLDGKPPANSAAVRVARRPGQAFSYSGGGYTVAQLLMSEAGGQPFAPLMQRRVLQPLGMADSSFAQPLPAAQIARAAAGVTPDGAAVAGKRHTYPELAAAGLWTTSQDLARFGLGVQRALAGKSPLVSATLARDMLTGRVGGDYGLGFGLPTVGGEPYFAHGGWNEGFCASLMASQNSGQGAAILINANQPALIDELRRAVAHEYGWPGFKTLTPLPASAEALDKAPGRYRVNAEQAVVVTRQGQRLFIGAVGEPVSELVPVAGGRYLQRDQELARRFEPDADGRWQLRMERAQGGPQLLPRLPDDQPTPRERLLAGDQAGALAAYRALRDSGDEAGSEAYLNRQAYGLARGGSTATAVALMTLNTELYPGSANAWDSLGEVHLMRDDKPQARQAYRKALALQPNLGSAQAALRRLGDN